MPVETLEAESWNIVVSVPEVAPDVIVYRSGKYAIAVNKWGDPIAVSEDHAQALRKAVNHVASKGGGKIFVTGKFKLTSTITVPAKPIDIKCGAGTIFDCSSLNDIAFKGDGFDRFRWEGGKFLNYNNGLFWFRNGNLLVIKDVELELEDSYTPTNDVFTRIAGILVKIMRVENTIIKENFQVDMQAIQARMVDHFWAVNNYGEKVKDYLIYACSRYPKIIGNTIKESKWGLAYVEGNYGGYGVDVTDVHFEIIGNHCIITDESGSANIAAILLRERGSGKVFEGVVLGNYIYNYYTRGIAILDNAKHIVVSENVVEVPADSNAIEEWETDDGTPDYNNIISNVIISGKIVRKGTHTIVRHNQGFTTERSDVAVFSGDGSTTQFKIPHGLVGKPSKVIVTPLSADARDFSYAEADDTYIYFNFSTAPPPGTDNVKLSWYAEV